MYHAVINIKYTLYNKRYYKVQEFLTQEYVGILNMVLKRGDLFGLALTEASSKIGFKTFIKIN